MNGKKKQGINVLANKLVEVLGLKSPIAIEKVPGMLGGNILWVGGDIGREMKAMVQKEGEESFSIYIDKNISIEVQRFTIAQEIGHLFIHMGYLINPKLWANEEDYKDSVHYRYGYSKEKLEANEFAMAFLMPETEFLEVANQNLTNGYYELQKIAKHFGVSKAVANARGKQLRIFSWENNCY